ncbi:MAG: hypothetical protein ACKVX7_15605 [Planctomycetota bacterium]
MDEPGLTPSMRIDCEHCGQSIEIPRTLKGGLTNCHACQRIVAVRGSTDVFFFTLLSLGISAIIGGTVFSYYTSGIEVACSVFGIGASWLIYVLQIYRS